VRQSCAGRAASSVSWFWHRPGEASAVMSSSSSRSSSPPLPPSSPVLVCRRRKGRQGLLGFRGPASGFLRGGPRVAAWAWTPRAVMPGVRTTATRRASGDCRHGTRVCSAGGRVAGEKRGRARGRLRCAVAERSWRGWSVTGAEAGAQVKEKKGKGATVRAPCRGAGRAADGASGAGGKQREEGES
jgi:hypothetical protein